MTEPTETPSAVQSHGSHKRSSRRTVSPAPLGRDDLDEGTTIFGRCVTALWPWRLGEYPGWSVCAAKTLNYAVGSIRHFAKGTSAPSATCLRKTANVLRSRAQSYLALAQECDQAATRIVQDAQARAVRPFRTMALEERQGWRSAPRAKRSKHK